MSVRFSRVKLISKDKAALFLVGGVPQSQDDLEGWTAFQAFSEELTADEPITVCVETFEYGDGEPVDATPEEVAYFYMRCERRPDFIESRSRKAAESEFFMWLKK